jgi:hypothetical protein
MRIKQILLSPAAALFLCCAALGSVSAYADIYTWTDARGSLNFSNLPPPKSDKVKNVQVVAAGAAPVSAAGDPVPPRQASPTERELLARVKNLERQLAEQQKQQLSQQRAAPAYYQAPPPPPRTYYQPPPPPSYYQPPPAYYDPSADTGYYPAYPVYYYPVVPAYAVYPRRAYYFAPRPAFVGGHFGGFGGGHGARR